MILGSSSIRLRLTLWNAAVLMLILVVLSLGSFFFMRSRLESIVRSRLENGYLSVEAVVRNSDADLSDIYHLGQELLFQLSQNGRVVYQTLSWQDIMGAGTLPNPRFSESGSWRSASGSLYWLKKGMEPVSGVEIVFAQDITSTRTTLRSLAVILTAGIPIALILAVFGGYFLAGRALSPVKAITKKAGEINAECLSERLPVPNPRDEIGCLASVFNETLARLDSSFKRLQRFTSDASHELRTPLTSIRSVGEVALQGSSDALSCREAISSMLEETERLTQVVDNLLTLARGDAGKSELSPRALDLSVLAAEVVDELRVLSEEKGQSFFSDLQPSVMVTADQPTLRQALINVFHNAITYTPQKGHIEVRVMKTEEGKAIIDFIDDGPGIPQTERAKVFERFYRVQGARSRKDGGVGLGLSIAQWAVEANGGTIAFLDKKGPGAHCRITLSGRREDLRGQA